MKSNIVRNIDEFGRLTLPKDIRKRLNIKEEEFVELVFNDNEIVLKKHLPMTQKDEFYQSYAETISLGTGKNVAISDRDRIVATAGTDDFNKKYYNKPVSSHLDEIIKGRTATTLEKEDNISFAHGLNETSRCIIVPICEKDKILGTVIICSDFADTDVDEFLMKIGSIAANFLGKIS